MKRIEIFENGIFLVFDIDDNGAELAHLSALPLDESLLPRSTGSRPLFEGFSDAGDQTGRLIGLSLAHRETAAHTTVNFRFFNGISAVKIYPSAGAPLPDRYCPAVIVRSAAARLITASGDMSRGILHDPERGEYLAWQCPRAELSAEGGHILLRLYPRSEDEPCLAALSSAEDGLNAVLGELTRCRRAMRRKTRDSKTLGVFFDGSFAPAEDTPKLTWGAAVCECNYFSLSAGLPQRDLSVLAKDVYACVMTPACVIPADTPAEAIADIAREYRFAGLTLTDAQSSAALASLAAEVISLRRDIIIDSSLADARTVSLGLLHSTPCLTLDDLLLAPPEQTVAVCDVDKAGSPAELVSALAAALTVRLRITGRADLIHPKTQLLVKEAVTVLKRIRTDTAAGLPIIADGKYFGSVSADGRRIYIAVPCFSEDIALPLPQVRDGSFSAECIFPQSFGGSARVSDGVLHISPGDSCSAGLFLLESR